MIDPPVTTIHSPPEQLAVQSKNGWPLLWRRLALAGVMLISIFMNFYQLGQNGFGNLYYASAIRSMHDSWHNFFFVSLLVKNGTVRYFLLYGSGGGGPGGGQSTLISWITQHGTVVSSSQWQSSSSSGSGQLYEITSVS